MIGKPKMEKKCFNKKQLFTIIVVVAIVCFFVGYGVGSTQSTAWCVNAGLKILEAKNISIEVNKDLIQQAFYQYKNNIGSLLNAK